MFLRVLCGVAALALVCAASADEFTDRLNAAYQGLADSKRAETIIMPALGNMQEPPGILLGRADRVLLLTTSSPAWASATNWSTADPQQAVLEALATITQEGNPRRAMRFALPYGINGVSTAWVRKELHAELGDPPTIAAVQMGYLNRMQWLESLVHIEATRLAGESEYEQAMEIVFDLAMLGRMIADRQLAQEVQWGLNASRTAMMRLRDLAYVDSQEHSVLNGEFIKDIIARIDMERGMFRLDRLRLPVGDQVAAEQMASRVFGRSGAPDQSVFPTAMAELAATSRPLRLFSESGRWKDAAENHASKSQTDATISGIYSDWAIRWDADTFDPTFRTPSAYDQLDAAQYAMVKEIVSDLDELFVLRRELDAELVGTRVALAVRALIIEAGGMPSSLALVRPRYVSDLGVDPYNPNRRAGNMPEMKFFVPVRDTVQNQLHTMSVVPANRTNFSVRLDDEQFVLYSLGGNEFDDRATVVSDSGLEQAGDYLIWPPVLGLLREYLDDTGGSE